MSPGPAVTAMRSISPHSAPPSRSARATSGKRCWRCSRDAISGTTPPKGWCRSICEAMRFVRTLPSDSSSATEVSSQDVSIPRIKAQPATRNPQLIIRAPIMADELPTRYEPAQIERRWYEFWENGEFFTPLLDRDRPKFSIVIPPPNVTGRLHIGHALVNTLQDIVVRWKRMSGFNTLWRAGAD